MRILFCFLLVIQFLQLGNAQTAATLSPDAYASLWTVEPGTELYSIFGHSAIQIHDPKLGINQVYNYGTFDFETEDFYLKFMCGQLLYFLNIEPYRYFERSNQMDRRAMAEQVLNLDSTRLQSLWQALQTNAQESNKYYKYHFFYDNCATRIRDVFQSNADFALNWDSTHVRKGITMRDLLHEHLTEMPWSEFGIDILLGAPCDKRPTGQEYMFLPIYLHDVVGKTVKPDGAKLVKSERKLESEYAKPASKPSPITSPLAIMSLVAAIGLLSIWYAPVRKVFDVIFWTSLSLIGVLICFLWFFSDHGDTKFNLNLLWSFPMHILLFAKRKTSEWAENYYMGLGIACFCMVFVWPLLPQKLPVAIIPILVLIVAKCYFMRYEKERV